MKLVPLKKNNNSKRTMFSLKKFKNDYDQIRVFGTNDNGFKDSKQPSLEKLKCFINKIDSSSNLPMPSINKQSMPDLMCINISSMKQSPNGIFSIKNKSKGKKNKKRNSVERNEFYDTLPYIQFKQNN